MTFSGDEGISYPAKHGQKFYAKENQSLKVILFMNKVVD